MWGFSPFLKENLITTEERATKETLKERTQKALQEALRAPETASKKVVKLLSETLVELEDAESRRMLLGLAKDALSGPVNKEKMSYAARIVRELARADIGKGGNAAMRFLARKEISPRFFRYFSKILIEEDFS